MKIRPIVSNMIEMELEDGSCFELYEGTEGLSIRATEGSLRAKQLNVETAGMDNVWEGISLTLAVVKEKK